MAATPALCWRCAESIGCRAAVYDELDHYLLVAKPVYHDLGANS